MGGDGNAQGLGVLRAVLMLSVQAGVFPWLLRRARASAHRGGWRCRLPQRWRGALFRVCDDPTEEKPDALRGEQRHPDVHQHDVGADSSRTRNPARISAWSSASSTRIMHRSAPAGEPGRGTPRGVGAACWVCGNGRWPSAAPSTPDPLTRGSRGTPTAATGPVRAPWAGPGGAGPRCGT